MFVMAMGGYILYKSSDSVRVQEQLDLGEKYLAELDYDQAIVAYETVLEIEPMNVEAYLGLSDAYIGKDDYESALAILQKGYDLTADYEIKIKIDGINEEIERVKAEKVRLEEEERKHFGQVNDTQFNIDLEEMQIEELEGEAMEAEESIIQKADIDNLLECINQYRNEEGLPELVWDSELEGACKNALIDRETAISEPGLKHSWWIIGPDTASQVVEDREIVLREEWSAVGAAVEINQNGNCTWIISFK